VAGWPAVLILGVDILGIMAKYMGAENVLGLPAGVLYQADLISHSLSISQERQKIASSVVVQDGTSYQLGGR